MVSEANDPAATAAGLQAILEMLPHRFPFLLVDRVVACEPGRSLRAIKNVTANDAVLPIQDGLPAAFPATLLVESMAQATGLLAVLSAEEQTRGLAFFLIGIDQARFHGAARVGDRILIEVEVVRITQGVGKFNVEAWVRDQRIARLELMCAARPGAPV